MFFKAGQPKKTQETPQEVEPFSFFASDSVASTLPQAERLEFFNAKSPYSVEV